MLIIDGVAIAYEQAAPPQPAGTVVLLHAGVADMRMWDHQFQALAERYRVIRYDQRGHGRSGDAAGEVCHYQDLLAVMDALEVERAALVGSSMGGAYATEAALAAPARVAGLALIGSGLAGHEWPPEMLDQARERVHSSVPADRLARYREGDAGHVDPADVLAMAEAHTSWQVAGPDRTRDALTDEVWQAAVEMLRLVFERSWTGPRSTERHLVPPAVGRLPEITAPTLVINGLSDVPGIQEVASLLAVGIGGARRIDLPATGHLPPLERPAEVTDALTTFLSRVFSEDVAGPRMRPSPSR
ncbi:alpha/beta fold hydrolase [Nonomuraea jiangxiensis]|uniref:Pimeloyl-ACP methyl ester carboxylesterase n=1 Tax=Nonomuraea jiangxiensis TaxID=633440 RepID=A0A1G8JRS4_9ACTN|nr:alpha/beta hydrolase [Nonomuraea jiangxiensis]SDI33896.1 Pimeloyl-ACP methyl ester carboxylesterase [Nonomuraea jiangxiensis]